MTIRRWSESNRTWGLRGYLPVVRAVAEQLACGTLARCCRWLLLLRRVVALLLRLPLPLLLLLPVALIRILLLLLLRLLPLLLQRLRVVAVASGRCLGLSIIVSVAVVLLIVPTTTVASAIAGGHGCALCGARGREGARRVAKASVRGSCPKQILATVSERVRLRSPAR